MYIWRGHIHKKIHILRDIHTDGNIYGINTRDDTHKEKPIHKRVHTDEYQHKVTYKRRIYIQKGTDIEKHIYNRIYT